MQAQQSPCICLSIGYIRDCIPAIKEGCRFEVTGRLELRLLDVRQTKQIAHHIRATNCTKMQMMLRMIEWKTRADTIVSTSADK